MKFRQQIQQANPQLENIPRGFNRYGDTMILRSEFRLTELLGETILEQYPWCQSVYQHLTTRGETRKPELVHLAGTDNPEVVHKENGVKYLINLAQITFSGGNRRLRERMVDSTEDGEYLVDMFAAVGNLSMQPLFHREISATLIEKDPVTYRYLQKTVEMNKIAKVRTINADCRDVDLINIADRISMGYHNVDHTHLKKAVEMAKKRAVIHLHPLAKPDRWDEWVSYYDSILENIGVQTNLIECNQIKSYSPGLEHVEIVIAIEKSDIL